MAFNWSKKELNWLIKSGKEGEQEEASKEKDGEKREMERRSTVATCFLQLGWDGTCVGETSCASYDWLVWAMDGEWGETKTKATFSMHTHFKRPNAIYHPQAKEAKETRERKTVTLLIKWHTRRIYLENIYLWLSINLPQKSKFPPKMYYYYKIHKHMLNSFQKCQALHEQTLHFTNRP